MRAAFLALFLWTAPAAACQTALVLSMDVSNSVDLGEWRLQRDGLARALRDPEIAEILVRDGVALTVLQWSGATDQTIALPWQRMLSAAQVESFAAEVAAMPRAFVMSGTAPAEALAHALDQFATAPACTRRIVDLSGDGTPNDGGDLAPQRRRAERMGVTVNGLAIEGLGMAMTNYYRGSLITRDGFVVTARGYRDYARAIRIKILREISRVFG